VNSAAAAMLALTSSEPSESRGGLFITGYGIGPTCAMSGEPNAMNGRSSCRRRRGNWRVALTASQTWPARTTTSAVLLDDARGRTQTLQPGELELLDALVARRRSELQSEALARGWRDYRRKPRTLAKRVAAAKVRSQ
jgi:hypothetical protein